MISQIMSLLFLIAIGISFFCKTYAQTPSPKKKSSNQPAASTPNNPNVPGANQKKAKPAEGPQSMEKSEIRAVGGSAANRAEKKFFIGLMPIGFIARPAHGGVLALSMSSKSSLELFGETGSYSVFGYSSSRLRAGLRYLWFPGNSFYLSGGLGFDNVTYENKSILFASSFSEKLSHNQMEIEAGLGNRWQMDGGFSIGATWIGFSQGVLKLGQKYELTNASETDSVKPEPQTESKLAKDASTYSLHFTKLVPGWSF